MSRYKFSTVRITSNARVLELDTPNVEETDAYDKKPIVRSDARELHENLILSEFPDDPIPMPSDHMLELLFEYAALKAQTRPNTLHTLHPSVLLSTAIIVNDYIKDMLTPSVLEHVNRCLDAEEAEEAAMAEPLNTPRDQTHVGEYEDFVDADEQAEDIEEGSIGWSDNEELVAMEEGDSTTLPSTLSVPRLSAFDELDEEEQHLRARVERNVRSGVHLLRPQAPPVRSKRASAHAAVAKMSGNSSKYD